jgi:hypothetical protein
LLAERIKAIPRTTAIPIRPHKIFIVDPPLVV